MPHHELIWKREKLLFWTRKKRYGRLLSAYRYENSLTGYNLKFRTGDMLADLREDGTLWFYPITDWDFGTFAIDDPAMVYGSLEHDFYCKATDAGLLPWSVRYKADKLLGRRLDEAGSGFTQKWRVPGVMLNSQLIARWKRKK